MHVFEVGMHSLSFLFFLDSWVDYTQLETILIFLCHLSDRLSEWAWEDAHSSLVCITVNPSSMLDALRYDLRG